MILAPAKLSASASSALVSAAACVLLAAGMLAASRAAAAEPTTPKRPELAWKQTKTSLALTADAKVLWQYHFDKAEGKPYFHPLAGPDGTVLTDLRPADHVWHRGLWFSWKYVNGVNYWEEDRKTGLSPGRTEIAKIDVAYGHDFSARFLLDLTYHPADKPVVMTEKRFVKVSAPRTDGGYAIDWHGTFTAGKDDVKLTRQPIPGQKGGTWWGGYAGLGVRMAKFAKQWHFHNSQGQDDKNRKGNPNPLKGVKARWVVLHGATPAGAPIGVAVMDHPDNPRHPIPWALYHDLGYLGTGMLHQEGYTIPAGKTLTLKYRVLVQPGTLDLKELEKAWKAFAGRAQ